MRWVLLLSSSIIFLSLFLLFSSLLLTHVRKVFGAANFWRYLMSALTLSNCVCGRFWCSNCCNLCSVVAFGAILNTTLHYTTHYTLYARFQKTKRQCVLYWQYLAALFSMVGKVLVIQFEVDEVFCCRLNAIISTIGIYRVITLFCSNFLPNRFKRLLVRQSNARIILAQLICNFNMQLVR